MKIAIAIILLLALCAYGQSTQLHQVKKGSELISLLEGDLPGTYLLFFYDHNADKGRTNQFRNDAREQILARHPDIHYYEIDVDDSEYQDIVNKVGIDKVETGHMPTFVVLYQGLGYRVHGEQAVKDIVNSLSGKDWWLAHRHQRTEKEVEDEKAAAAAAKK
jgi:hypothetical protein